MMPTLFLLVMLASDGFVFVESDIQLQNAVESAAEAGLCQYIERAAPMATITSRVENIVKKVWMITKESQDLSSSIDILQLGLFDPDTKTFTSKVWGDPTINALRLSVNHESGSSNAITGFFTHVMGMTGGVTLHNDMVAYYVDTSLDPSDLVYEYRFHHCQHDSC